MHSKGRRIVFFWEIKIVCHLYWHIRRPRRILSDFGSATHLKNYVNVWRNDDDKTEKVVEKHFCFRRKERLNKVHFQDKKFPANKILQKIFLSKKNFKKNRPIKNYQKNIYFTIQ